MANKKSTCYMSDLARECGVDVATFQAWFTLQNWLEVFALGYRPYVRLLSPNIVRYIRSHVMSEYDQQP